MITEAVDHYVQLKNFLPMFTIMRSNFGKRKNDESETLHISFSLAMSLRFNPVMKMG